MPKARWWRIPALAAAGALLAAAASGAEPEVVVCGPHHHVLGHWLAAAEAGRLPRAGVTIVHVDAHPDLAIPPAAVPRGWPASIPALVARTDVASFQLAAVRAGLVEEIVWLRPRWARQLEDGPRRFLLGLDGSGHLRVDDPADYYVLDGSWARSDALRDTQTVRVRVLPLDEAFAGGSLADGPVVLDVDLDVFATRNHAAERLRRAGLTDEDVARIREIFDPAGLALSADPAARVRDVDELTGAIGAAIDADWGALPGALGVFWRRGIGPLDLWWLWRALARADERALDTLLEDGRDVVGLPERAADPQEIATTARQIAALVSSGAVRPALVTIARSVDGGFTPRAAWPDIERRLLTELAPALPHSPLRDCRVLGDGPGVGTYEEE